MAKTRIKIPVTVLATRDEAEFVMNELANTANNRRKLAARLDAAVLKLQQEAAPGIAECDKAIDSKTAALRAWADANPLAFPKGRKSIAFLSGVMGFRTGTPKLALLNRKWNWETVLTTLKGLRMMPNFIRTAEEVDREAIIAQRENEAIKELLPTVGLKVVQNESFYVEPKLTDADAKQLTINK